MLACCLFIFALATFCLSACGSAPVERRGASQLHVVKKVISGDLQEVRARVLTLFSGASKSLPRPFDRLRAVELKPPNYFADWVVGFIDPGGSLEHYKRIPVAERIEDLLLEEPAGDVYWPSEYVNTSGVLRFRCGFIVHFTQLSGAATEVQVFEKTPQIWVGEKWGFARHGLGFGRFHEIRFVEPTVKERFELIGMIEAPL